MLEKWFPAGLCWRPSAAGLFLGAVGSWLLFRPAAVSPAAQDAAHAPEAPQTPVASNEPTPPPPATEAVRISMEEVVSELEHRYDGRQADKPAAEKRPRSQRSGPR
jgi:hypothetical protein